MNDSIKVSVILSTFNGSAFLKKAIESVLIQSHKNLELIIVDDGSTDETLEIIKSFSEKDTRVKYISNEKNIGVQKSRNEGLNLAQGEFVAIIDDDDEWIDVYKIEKQINFLISHTGHILVGTGVIVVDQNGLEKYRYTLPESDIDIRKKLLFKNCFAHSTILFNKDVAIKIGGYDESSQTKNVEDYDFILRLALHGLVSNIKEFAINYTDRSSNNSSTHREDIFKKNIYLVKKYKNYYPNYLGAIIFSLIRLFFYRFFYKILSENIRKNIIKLYRSF